MCILTDKINNGYYCVPVYVFQALKKLGYSTSFDSIANDLKVKIPTERLLFDVTSQ